MGVPFSNSLIPVIHIIPVNPRNSKYITLGDVFGSSNVKSPLIASDYFDLAGSFMFKRFQYSSDPLTATLEFIDPTFSLFEKILALINRTESDNLISVATFEVTLGWAFKGKTASDVVYPRSRSQTLRLGNRLNIKESELLGIKYFCRTIGMQYSVQQVGIHYTLTLVPDSTIKEQIYSQSKAVMPTNCQYLSILYKLAAEMNLLLLIDESVNMNQLTKTATKFAFENKTNIDNFLRLVNTINEPGKQFRPIDISISNQEDDARAAMAQMSGMYKDFTRATDTINLSSISSIINNNAYAYTNPVPANEISSTGFVKSVSGDTQKWSIGVTGDLPTDPPPLQGNTGKNLTSDQLQEWFDLNQSLSYSNLNTTQSLPNSNELWAEGISESIIVNKKIDNRSDREKQMLSESIKKIMQQWSTISNNEYKDWKVLVITEEPNIVTEEPNIDQILLDYNLRGKKFLGVYSHFAKDEQESNVGGNGKDSVLGFTLTSNFTIDDSLGMITQRKLYDAINEHCGKPLHKLIDIYNIAFGNTSKSALAATAGQKYQTNNAVSQLVNTVRTKSTDQQVSNNYAGVSDPIKSGTASSTVGNYNANAAQESQIVRDAQNSFYNYIREMLNLPANSTISDIYQAANKQQDGSLSDANNYLKGTQFNFFMNEIENHVNEYFQSTINPEASSLKLIKQVTKVALLRNLYNEIDKYGAYNIIYNKQAMTLTLRTVGDIALSFDLCNSSLLYLKFFNPNGTLNRFLTGYYLLQSYSHSLNSDSFFVTEMQVIYWQLVMPPITIVEPGNTTDNINTGQPIQFNSTSGVSNSNNNPEFLRSFSETGTTLWSTVIGSTGDKEAIFQSTTSYPDSSKGSNLNVTQIRKETEIIKG